MKFKTYYINLEKDKKRNEETIYELNKTNLKYERFNGIDGNKIDKYNDTLCNRIPSICKKILTNKIIGCALSHIMLYKYIKQCDKNNFALILEDDIEVINPELNYKKEINKIVKTYNKIKPNWEIIRLHSMGMNLG